MSLILIDNRVSDQKIVIDSLLPDTKYVIVDYQTDSLETLQNKIAEVVTNITNITNIGIFQENYNTGNYQYVGQFGQATLTDVETLDPEITTWTDFTSLLTYFKNVLNATNLDLMGCNIHRDSNWRYVIGKLENLSGLVIRSSDDYTGSSGLGGNWILESDNVDLIGTYFTEYIKNYKFILGGLSDSYSSYVLGADSILYACGNNGYGQFGNGTNGVNYASNVLTPVSTVPIGKKCIQYSYGLYHLIVLLDDGTVYGCGRNNSGQLGNGTLNDTSSLIKCVLPTPKTAIQVSCGDYTSYVLMNDGTLYSCGYNPYGQLGDGSTTNSSSFLMAQNNTGKKIVSISPDTYFIMCLLEDGTVYGFGSNYGGQFGNSTSGISYLNFTQFVNNTGKTVKQISCGGGTTLMLMTDNTVYGCGSNNYNKLSVSGTNFTSLVQVPTTVLSSATITRIQSIKNNIYLLTSSGYIYGCGDNFSGQLGNGTYTNSSTLTKMTAISGKTPISMYCACDNIIATMNDGTVYACGYNIYGQLATNDGVQKNILTQMKLTSTTYITGVNIKSNINIILINGTMTYNGNNNFSNNNTLGIIMYTLDYGLDTYKQIMLSSIIGNYNDYNVGTNIPIQISVLLLKNFSSGTTITNYLYPSTQVITGTINKKELTYTVSSTKVYDGNNTATVTFNFDGLVAGEIPNKTYTATYDNINVGTKNVTVTGVTLSNNGSFLANNYSYSSSIPPFSGTITTKPLTYTYTCSKIYDGTTNGTLTFNYIGLVNTEVPSTNYTATFNNANVGLRNLSVSDILLVNNQDTGFLTTNYSYTNLLAATITNNIVPKLLTITANVTDKVYDGTNVATNNITLTFGGLVGTQTPNYNMLATYLDADVGTNKQIGFDYISTSNNFPFLSSNYTLGTYPTVTGNIVKRELTVFISNSTPKTYNGNTGATVNTTVSLSGSVSGETPSFVFTAVYDDPNVGTGKKITVSAITLGDNLPFKQNNYYITNTAEYTNGSITAKQLTVSTGPNGVTTKGYDGNTNAQVDLAFSGIVPGEDIDYTYNATFDNKNANTVKAVTINSIDLVSTPTFLKNNYSLGAFPNPKGTISRKILDVSVNSVTDKVYNGILDDANQHVSLGVSGTITGETPYFTFNASYNSVDVGDNKGIIITSMDPNDNPPFLSGNYTIETYPVTTGKIIPANLIVQISSVTKEYDGTTDTGIVNLNFTGLVAGETANYSSYSVIFDDPNVGTDKTVSINVNLLQSGTFKPANYIIDTTSNTSNKGTITAKPATVTPVTASNKIYDGTNSAQVTLQFTGLVIGQTPIYNCPGSFTNYNSGNNRPVTVNVNNITYTENNLFKPTNYLFTFINSSSLTANISKRTLTYSIDTFTKQYDGTIVANPVITFSGLAPGEQPNYTSDCVYETADVGTGKTVTLNSFNLLTNSATKFNPGNYDYFIDLVTVNNAEITPRVLVPSINNLSKEYDGSDSTNITFTYDDLPSGETPIYNYTSKYNDKNVGTQKTITVSNIVLGTNGNFKPTNYSYENTLVVPNCIISAKPLTATITSVTNKEYDGTRDAAVALSFTGAVVLEEPSASYTASFNNANAGTGKQVTVNTINLITNVNFNHNNYTVTAGQVGTGTITAKALTASIVSVTNKEYDGTVSAIVTLSFTGAVPTETPNYNYTASFDTPSIGTGKQVTVNTINLLTNGIFNPGNYTVLPGQVSTGNITTKTLTASVATVTTKVYDGTTVAISTLLFNGVAAGEVANYNCTSSFNTPNVGTGKVVTINNITLTDNMPFIGSNYTVAAGQVSTGTITSKPLTATIRSVANKVYDGTTTAAALLSVTGSVTGETPLWTNTATFNTKTAGNNKLVTIRSISLRNNGAFIATNYRISVGQTKLANITKRLLGFKYLVKSRKYIKGNKKATMVFSAYNKLAADIVAISKYTATYNNDAIGNNKPVTMTGAVLSGRDSANYYVLGKYTTKGNITK